MAQYFGHKVNHVSQKWKNNLRKEPHFLRMQKWWLITTSFFLCAFCWHITAILEPHNKKLWKNDSKSQPSPPYFMSNSEKMKEHPRTTVELWSELFSPKWRHFSSSSLEDEVSLTLSKSDIEARIFHNGHSNWCTHSAYATQSCIHQTLHKAQSSVGKKSQLRYRPAYKCWTHGWHFQYMSEWQPIIHT